MEIEAAALDVIEKKIEKLEQIVYGINPNATQQTMSVIESLLAANTLLNAAANGRNNISSVYKRLEELNSDLGEESFGEPGAELDRRLNVIITLQDQYVNNAAVLEKIARLNAALDDGNLKSIEEARSELILLVDQYAALTSEMTPSKSSAEVLSAWKSLVLEVSRGLAAANNAFIEVENKKLGLDK